MHRPDTNRVTGSPKTELQIRIRTRRPNRADQIAPEVSPLRSTLANGSRGSIRQSADYQFLVDLMPPWSIDLSGLAMFNPIDF